MQLAESSCRQRWLYVWMSLVQRQSKVDTCKLTGHLEAEHAYAVLATRHEAAFLIGAELDCLYIVV